MPVVEIISVAVWSVVFARAGWMIRFPAGRPARAVAVEA